VTHELGHAIGFGHSAQPDAIMRSSAYGARGPRLGADDRDAAHCAYPHGITLLIPNGGESWDAGSQQAITWQTTEEAGPDAGLIDLEYSEDGGLEWQSVAAGLANDGHYQWNVPSLESANLRVRAIRHNLSTAPGSPFPSACSLDGSNASFSITTQTPLGGTISRSLRLDKAAGGQLRLSWNASCSRDTDDYAVYSGALATLRSGTLAPQPLTCSAGVDLAEYVTPSAGDSYFLVSPLAGSNEGGLGPGRSSSPASCAVVEESSVCPGRGSSRRGPRVRAR